MSYTVFDVGNFYVHGYGLMIAIGLVVGFILLDLRTPIMGLKKNIAWTMAIIALVFGFLGGKLLYMIVEWQSLIRDPLSVMGSSGFVVYGGIITGILASFIYAKIKKVSFLAYFDLLIPEVALCQGFGRIGCFLAGCCYGREAGDNELGVVFPDTGLAPGGVSLIPTQLYSAIGDFAIFFILIIAANVLKRKNASSTSGIVAGTYLLLYSAGRFVIEFFRADYRGSVGILSTSQFISIFIFAAGIFLIIFANSRKKQGCEGEKIN